MAISSYGIQDSLVKRVFKNIESTRSYEFFSISSKEVFNLPYKAAILRALKLQSFAILRHLTKLYLANLKYYTNRIV